MLRWPPACPRLAASSTGRVRFLNKANSISAPVRSSLRSQQPLEWPHAPSSCWPPWPCCWLPPPLVVPSELGSWSRCRAARRASRAAAAHPAAAVAAVGSAACVNPSAVALPSNLHACRDSCRSLLCLPQERRRPAGTAVQVRRNQAGAPLLACAAAASHTLPQLPRQLLFWPVPSVLLVGAPHVFHVRQPGVFPFPPCDGPSQPPPNHACHPTASRSSPAWFAFALVLGRSLCRTMTWSSASM